MKVSNYRNDLTLYKTWYEFRKELGNKLGYIPLNSQWLEIKPRTSLPWDNSHMQTAVSSVTHLYKQEALQEPGYIELNTVLSSHDGAMASIIGSRHMTVGKLAIHYFICGQGDPLVIIHGGGGEAAKGWLRIVKELSNYYTVYVPDLPGFGRSQAQGNDFQMLEFVEFVKDFSHKLGLKRFHLLGHSMGGGIALQYALTFPSDIKRLVLLNSMCLGKAIAPWIRFLSSAAFRLTKAIPTILKAMGWLIRLTFGHTRFASTLLRSKVKLGNSIATLKGQPLVLLHRLSELVMPALLIWGARDVIVPASQAKDAAELIPDCQLHIFEDCGHDVHKEKEQELSQLVAGFLC